MLKMSFEPKTSNLHCQSSAIFTHIALLAIACGLLCRQLNWIYHMLWSCIKWWKRKNIFLNSGTLISKISFELNFSKWVEKCSRWASGPINLNWQSSLNLTQITLLTNSSSLPCKHFSRIYHWSWNSFKWCKNRYTLLVLI